MIIILRVLNSLKEARKQAGLSQNDVATVLQVSRQSVSKWENGRGYPDLDNLIILSNLYGKSIDNLLKCCDPSSPRPYNNSPHNPKVSFDKRRKNESREEAFLLLLSLASSLIPSIAAFMPIYIIRKSSKRNRFYRLTLFVSVLVVLFNGYRLYTSISNYLLNITSLNR
ncbi:helix-turn-helix transcriptional regulator [Lentilactobacillus otakiensis]|uniref:helix-turn-helix transcriptional regulator n=1 Tax=Lentilactobacillus otakiensis TaxID=481720 RepID=UPI000B32E340|nr:helix-turn-helix transcriptional regulator [Lentilactobacillus otakiensis]MDV3517435.1 helix-turn-helix transcriptional regulator [Lentilactobacillus otakiensis]